MQTNLFLDTGNPDEYQEHQLGSATIREYPHAFLRKDADHLLACLIAEIPWQQDSIRIAGRQIAVPRLQCWMGDANSRYGYSGMRLQPVGWQDTVLNIRQRVQDLVSLEFNSVLLNYYRNGQDSVAWHADDEKELGTDPLIASVSLGAERPFQLKPKIQGSGANYRLLLQSGSVLIMGKGMQNNWLHQLPKVANLNQPRINLTFRNIL